MTDSEAQTPAKISTPLQLRALAQSTLDQLDEMIVGTPRTGTVHRGLMLETASHRPIKADIVEPDRSGPHPVMVFIHGGGWVMGDLDTHHQVVLRFAEQGFLVIALEYGLAPEEPFPAGYDDAVAGIRWTFDNIARYGGDPQRLVLAGDSAGANIAAGIAVSEPDLPVRALALIYGVYDLARMPTSPDIHADDFLPNLQRAYLGSESLHLLNDARVSPIHAAEKLPPAVVVVGSSDPLVTESGELVDRLSAAGIAYEHVVIPEYRHAFLHMETLPQTLPSYDTIASFLHRHSKPSI